VPLSADRVLPQNKKKPSACPVALRTMNDEAAN